MQKSCDLISQTITMMQENPARTNADDDVITCLEVAREAHARGINFLNVDIQKSKATIFDVVDDKNVRIPFVAVAGLGESVAQSIVAARQEKEFTSIDDVMKRTRLSKTLCDYFKKIGAFGDLPEKEEEKLSGLFNFL
jgi:DNA polymerase-3 subunit alpha (Gram-positive type)